MAPSEPRLIDMPIEVARRVKWERGQRVYGPTFVGHPLEQFDEEMIDALNYLDEAERWGYAVPGLRERVTAIAEEVRKIYGGA